MARQKPSEGSRRRRRPATSPEERELELASAAYDLAEEQIRGGTASSQVITHFLKAGSGREELERQRIQHENELLAVKKTAIEDKARIEELFTSAIDAMRRYSGHGEEEEHEPE